MDHFQQAKSFPSQQLLQFNQALRILGKFLQDFHKKYTRSFCKYLCMFFLQKSSIFEVKIPCIIYRLVRIRLRMIYEIYVKYYDDKYSPSLHISDQPKAKSEKATLRSLSKQLLPYHVPPDHYDYKKLSNSLHQLTQHVKDNKENNKYLASRILFSQGKSQTRKFLHRTKQLFGNKPQALKKKKIVSSEHVTMRNSFNSTPAQNYPAEFVNNQELYFETYLPDFTVQMNRQPPEIRQNRRRTLGIKEADLQNYEEVRRGLPPTHKRREKKKDSKDFKKLNMKGFAAKISATLELRQKVSTKTLVRLMNVKFYDDPCAKKRVA